ncbi:Pre-mRNA 3'-end-processing factor FIP1 [Strongyloides ratti]|uniref:Pre-mRNA 3'-end-processing factor FIP1 n=1 Tax=Strongyloides ratti TaxID=34506 RepID=A0A090LCI1_STRRB|nr:Pre-mRNA 3'-end-processing factor FIP1 [Strongyloides ratti]CEF67506.1 Pre-mRNA 3'-end-processing factor FIP1 [Strongyloides ratti]
MDEGSYESYDGLPEDDSLNPFQDEYPMDEEQESFINNNALQNEAEDDDDDNFDEGISRPTSVQSVRDSEMDTATKKDTDIEDGTKQEAESTNSDGSDSDSEDDGVVVKIGDIKPTDIRRKGVVGKINIDGAPLVNGESIYDIDLNNIEDKPWRKPDTWNLYCERQRKLRLEYGNNQAQVNQVLFSQMNGGRQLVSLVGAENPHNNANPLLNSNNRIIITTDLTKKTNSNDNNTSDSVEQTQNNPINMPIGMDFSKPPPMFDSTSVSSDSLIHEEEGTSSIKLENDIQQNNNSTTNGNMLPSQQGGNMMIQGNNLSFNPMRPPPNLPNMFPNNFVKNPMFNNFMPPTFGSNTGKQPLIRHPLPTGNIINPSRGRFNDIGNDSRSPHRDSSEDNSRDRRNRRSRSRSSSRKRYDRKDRGRDDDSDRRKSDKHRESSRRSDREKDRDKHKDSERDRTRDRDKEREKDRERRRKEEDGDRERKRRRHRRDSEEDSKRKKKREVTT